MRFILGILTNRWFLALLGLLFLSLVILILGPLVAFAGRAPLESLSSRLFAICALVIVWLARKVWVLVRSRKANASIVEGIVRPVDSGPPPPDASEEEVALLKSRFEDAVSILRQSKGKASTQNLYELPWYIIIGPPGSGKIRRSTSKIPPPGGFGASRQPR